MMSVKLSLLLFYLLSFLSSCNGGKLRPTSGGSNNVESNSRYDFDESEINASPAWPGFGDDEDEEDEDSKDKDKSKSKSKDDEEEDPSEDSPKTLYEVIDSDFGILRDCLKEAGLDNAVKEVDDVTIFAPTDSVGSFATWPISCENE